MTHTAPNTREPQIPVWLADPNRIRATLAGYDNRPDPERNQTDRHDQDALNQLAELSETVSPWDAAVETFGGSE